MVLEAKNISFSYGNDGKQILNNFSMRIESHERVGIVAPSGFGKTTFCKILSGYEMPQSGEVLIDGKPLSVYKGYCPVQMIWQHPEQAVNPKLRMSVTIEEGDRIDDRIIKGLGIKRDWFNRYPAELSGGELQRFCIARALGKRTRFILADEITTMLDLITQSQIWSFLINEVKERNIGLLAVSHNMPLLQNVCTRVHEIDKQQ